VSVQDGETDPVMVYDIDFVCVKECEEDTSLDVDLVGSFE